MDEQITTLILTGAYEAALHELASAYSGHLLRLCASLLDSGAEAEELVQDTFLEAWTAMPSFRGDATARAWLFGIGRRLCLRHRKRKHRRRSLWQRWLQRQPEDTPGSPSAESRTIIEQALGQLKPQLREAVLLRYQLDCDHNEIAAILEIKPATARKRVSLGIQALRKAFDDTPSLPFGAAPAQVNPCSETSPGMAGIKARLDELQKLRHTPPSLPAFLPPAQIEARLAAVALEGDTPKGDA